MYLYNNVRLKPLFGDDLPWQKHGNNKDDNTNLESVKKDAYLQGHREGYEKGREEAEKKARDMMNQMEERHKKEIEALVEQNIKKLTHIIDDVSSLRKEIISRADKDILELALLIAKKVIKVEIPHNREQIIISNIQEAIKNAVDKDHIIIRLNPDDYNLLKGMKDLKEVLQAKEVILQQEPSISKGGCIVETKYSEIDARIESQLKSIEKKIKDQK